MDTMNILLNGSGIMPGLAANAASADTDALSGIDTESFGAVLSGLMSEDDERFPPLWQPERVKEDEGLYTADEIARMGLTNVPLTNKGGNYQTTSVSASAATATAGTETETEYIPASLLTDSLKGGVSAISLADNLNIRSALNRDFKLSSAAENAVTEFIGSYFKAGSDNKGDTSDYFTKWQKLLSELGNGELYQLSAFSAELQAAVFPEEYGKDFDLTDLTGGKFITDAGDAFIQVLGARTKKRSSSDSDIGLVFAQTIAFSGGAGMTLSDLMNISGTGDLMGTYANRSMVNIASDILDSLTGNNSVNEQAADLSKALKTDTPIKGTIFTQLITINGDDSDKSDTKEIKSTSGRSSGYELDDVIEMLGNADDSTVKDLTRKFAEALNKYLKDNNIASAVTSASSSGDEPEITAQMISGKVYKHVNKYGSNRALPTVNVPTSSGNVNYPSTASSAAQTAAEQAAAAQPAAAQSDQPEDTVQLVHVTQLVDDVQTEDTSEAAAQTVQQTAAEVTAAAEETGAAEETAAGTVSETESGQGSSAEEEVKSGSDETEAAAQSAAAFAEGTAGAVDTAESAAVMTEDYASPVMSRTAEAVLDRISNIKNNENSELTIKLEPETLGEITVRISKSTSGDISVTLAANNPETQKLISSHTGELMQMLARGDEARIDINVVDPAETSSYMTFDMNSGNSFGYENNSGSANTGAQSGNVSSVSAVSADAEDIDDADYISEEAVLWTTA